MSNAGPSISKTETVELTVSVQDFSDETLLEECGRRGILDRERDISDFDDEEIAAAFHRRFGPNGYVTAGQVFEQLYAARAEVPQIVKDYLHQETGRTLP